jgi:hypothetical protein
MSESGLDHILDHYKLIWEEERNVRENLLQRRKLLAAALVAGLYVLSELESPPLEVMVAALAFFFLSTVPLYTSDEIIPRKLQFWQPWFEAIRAGIASEEHAQARAVASEPEARRPSRMLLLDEESSVFNEMLEVGDPDQALKKRAILLALATEQSVEKNDILRTRLNFAAVFVLIGFICLAVAIGLAIP